MATAKRVFRTQESLAEEKTTRTLVLDFLRERGFEDVSSEEKVTGTAVAQWITAKTPLGQPVKMKVRICWRPRGTGDAGRRGVAAQLRARLVNDNWDDTLKSIVDHEADNGATHFLVVHRDGATFTHAALIPLSELPAIWRKQRDISASLIKRGKLGNRSKNHAQNGASPTIWLMDKRSPDAHAVPDALWSWPGVQDVVRYPIPGHGTAMDDTFDDCPGLGLAEIGSDGAPKHMVMRSQVKRDPAVRRKVLERAAGGCERKGCSLKRDYLGFLDVHHILGVEKSDRVWNCVALCPNCHRDAHAAPDSDEINKDLLAFSSKFRHAAK